MIDSGMPDAWHSSIQPYLGNTNRSAKDISLILHTHGHGDHIGSDAAIRRDLAAKIAIHEADAEAIENPREWARNFLERYGKYVSEESRRLFTGLLLEPMVVDMHLKDGDVIELEAMKLKVIHTPGHSKGSICLYDEKKGTLFSGDSIQAQGTVVSDISLVLDVDDYLSSMERLSEMRIEMILPGHFFKPFNKIALKADEAKRFILESRRNTEAIAGRISGLLRLERSPLGIGKITERVCREFGTGCASPAALAQAQFTIASHLSKLLSNDEIETNEKGKTVTFVAKK